MFDIKEKYYIRFQPFKNGCYSNSIVQAFLSLKRFPEFLKVESPIANHQYNFIGIINNYLELKMNGEKVCHTYDLRKLVDLSGNIIQVY